MRRYRTLVYLRYATKSLQAATLIAAIRFREVLASVGVSETSAFLLVVATYVIEFFWLEPRLRHADIVTAALRSLYLSTFGPTPGFRATYLAKRFPWSRKITPRFRYAYTKGTKLSSKARFAKGEALAGLLWRDGEHSGDVVPLVEFPDFTNGTDFDGDRFSAYMRESLALPDKTARKLSVHTRGLRWITGCAVVSPLDDATVGVLMIDSAKANSTGEINVELILHTAALIGRVISLPPTK